MAALCVLFCSYLKNNYNENKMRRVYKRSGDSIDKPSYLIISKKAGNFDSVEFIDYCKIDSYYYMTINSLDSQIITPCDKTISTNLYFKMCGISNTENNFITFTIRNSDSVDYGLNAKLFNQKGRMNQEEKLLLPIYFQGVISNDTIKLVKTYDFYGNRADELGTYILCEPKP